MHRFMKDIDLFYRSNLIILSSQQIKSINWHVPILQRNIYLKALPMYMGVYYSVARI